MSTSCYFCKKGVVSVGHRKHKHGGSWEYRAPRTTRLVKPNLRKVAISKKGESKRVSVCMKCYKKMKQKI